MLTLCYKGCQYANIVPGLSCEFYFIFLCHFSYNSFRFVGNITCQSFLYDFITCRDLLREAFTHMYTVLCTW